MSQIRVDEITDEVGTGSPSFPNGVAASDLTGDVAAARITDALNATGSAPIYACRAWVNFDGTGTVSIRASGNVSSITDNGTGDYTVNFATAMEDADYSLVGTMQPDIGSTSVNNFQIAESSSSLSVSNARIEVRESGAIDDSRTVCVAIFR